MANQDTDQQGEAQKPVEAEAQVRGTEGRTPAEEQERHMEQNMNKRKAMTIMEPSVDGPQAMPDRKRRRMAAAIATPEPSRPRLPMQTDTAAVFDTAAWRERWAGIRPVAETTSFYVAGATGSMRLGGTLGVPVLKPGTARDVRARMHKLNAERYGSMSIRDFAVVDEQGWDDWEPAKFSARPTHPASPVRVLPRALSVELPFWVTPQDFEALVVAALELVTLASLAASPVGRALCQRRGCATDTLLRYSRGARGPRLATEIAVVAPSGDSGRLVTLLERIVIRLVMADDGWEG